EVGLDEVVPDAVGIPSSEIVIDGEQPVTAPLVLELGDPVDDTRPCLRGVETGSHAAGGLEEVHRATVPRWYGMIDQRLNQFLEHGGGLRRIGAQRAILALGAELGLEVGGARKPAVKRQASLLAAPPGAKNAIADQRPDVLGEHLGVHRAEPGAVAPPNEGQLLVPYSGAQHVDVP